MRINQSLCLPMYVDLKTPVEAFLREVRAIGYPAVEIWGRDGVPDYAALFEKARSAGLRIASMGGHNSLTDGLNNVANHARIEHELRASIDIAAAWGIPGVICFAGNRLPGQSDIQGLVACAQGLRRILPYAEEKGVNLNVELLNSRVDHPFYLADRSDWGVALCEMAGSPRAKLLFDIYHMQIMEGDLIRTIRREIRHIGHFHTAGNPGRQDMDDTQELNYRGICHAIAAAGYANFVGHEFRPKQAALPALAAAFACCNV